MDNLYSYTLLVVWAAWAIACFVFYHKIFSVYYFDLFRGIYKELFWCSLIAALLAGVTFLFSTPLAIIMIIVGWILTRKIDSTVLRTSTFLLCIAAAAVIFFTGKMFQKNMEGETIAGDTTSTIEYVEVTDIEVTNQAAFHITESEIENTYIPYETKVTDSKADATYPSSETIISDDIPDIPETAITYLAGYVLESSGGLKIRSGPGISYQEVGRLSPNEQVIIYEQTYGESYIWGRIDRGWVCMDYIVTGTVPEYEETYKEGCIVGSDEGVNVRNGPAVSYEQIGKAYLGQRVIVTKLYHNGVSEWGFIGDGWICTDYIQFDAIPSVADDYENSDHTGSNILEWDKGEPAFVGYDCYGKELRVGYYVCIGARQGSSEFAVGIITGIQDNGIPVVEFTELHDYEYPEEIIYCISDLADKITCLGSYSCEVESQYLQTFYWG